MNLKNCLKCQTLKELDSFGKDKSRKDGLFPICRHCRSPRENKELVRRVIVDVPNGFKHCYKCSQNKIISDFHKNSRACKLCRKENPTKTLDPDKIKKQRDKSNKKRREDPETILRNRKYKKEYKLKNKQKIAETHKKYMERTEVRLRSQLRKRMNMALKNKSKVGSAINELGCDIDFLIQYLESKFQEGMSWDNYGKFGWHIDHIRPLSRFNLEDIDEFKKAAHYTNLQPLWAIDNLKKFNTYEENEGGCKIQR